MTHAKLATTLLLGTLWSLGSLGCGGSGGKSKAPLPALVAVVSYNQPRVAHTLTLQDTYPKRIETLRIQHTGTTADIRFSFVESKGAVRAVPALGIIEPGQTRTVDVEAIGLSYTETELRLTCIYDDRESTDQLDVPFGFQLNGGTFPGPKLVTVVHVTEPTKLRHLLTPAQQFPRQIDTMKVEYQAATGIPVRLAVGDPLGNLVGQTTKTLLQPGESADVDIRALRSQFGLAVLTLSVRYDIVAHDDELRLVWNVRNASPPNMAAFLALNVLTANSAQVPAGFWPGLTLDPIGVVVRHPAGGPRDKVPELLFTEAGVTGSLAIDLDAAQIGRAFWRSKTSRGSTGGDALFPPGEDRNGLTIHPHQEVDMPAGNYFVFHVQMERSLPVTDPEVENEHLYTFCADSDLQAANNWSAPPGLPFAPYQGTDRWYEIRYAKAQGWSLVVSQVGASNAITEVASAARAIVSDNAILMVVPSGEFGPVKPGWRAVSFVHQGDQGIDPPYTWSGDVVPAVGQPLLSFR